MRAIEILEAEHRDIESVLRALTSLLERDVAEVRANVAFFTRAADFIRDYADGSHHVKEEQVLFPAMARTGMPIDAGPLGCMLAEHAEGRLLAQAIAEEARSVSRGSGIALAALAENAWAYARLLSAHLRKEDEIIFRIARRVLPIGSDAELLAQYAQVDPAPRHALTEAAARLLQSLPPGRLHLPRAGRVPH